MVAEIEVPGANSDELILWELPITKVTAMVSPRARPRASMAPPTTPVEQKGRQTFHITSQLVEPRPYEASFNTLGTVSSTSRVTAEMKGRIMMERIRPAVKMPMPKVEPPNSVPSTGTSPTTDTT